MNYFSHPKKLLSSHIEKIVAFDKSDELFVLAAKFHDLGKATDSFQSYITGQAKNSEPHAFVSGILFLLQFLKKLDTKSLLFVLNAIASHHTSLKSLSQLFDSIYLKRKQLESQIEELASKDDVIKYFELSNFDFSSLYDFELDSNDPTNPLLFSIDDYIRQKELFSKLIFADKYEAIFSTTPTKSSRNYQLQNLYNFRATLQKNNLREMAREGVFKAFDKSPNESIYLLTAPTGIGKTLLSLELALKIKEQRGLERVIYTIPYTSIIDQTAAIFEKIYEGGITKHHHKAEYETTDDDINNDYDRLKFIVESWSEPFIISTFYQFFFALFSNDNIDNVKFQSLRNSVVVMDEVQAIAHQLWSVMREMFGGLSKRLNTVFILMSATMPIVTNKASELADKKSLFGAQNRYKLNFTELKGQNRDERIEELKNLIKMEYKKGKSVLCVLNTIKNSKRVFRVLNKELGANVYCLNSYMLPSDRERVIESLKEPNSNLVKNKILISTQVIEAGVDLDFDVGFRELSPLSSIIQTAGRVNREGSKGQADLFVFDTIDFEIYDKTLMKETKRHLIEALKNSTLEEQNILDYIESYFDTVGECLGDSKNIKKAIERFDFDAINRAINEIFKTEMNITDSVAIGVDLKGYEDRFFEQIKKLGKWELKSYKEQIFREISPKIINVKKEDLKNCTVMVEKSEIFGIYYIAFAEGVYSSESGFLIPEERDAESYFD